MDTALIKEGDDLKAELEREAATEELTKAIGEAKESRDAKALSAPLKRAKKAVDVDTALIKEGDDLKAELDEEKKAKEAKAKEEERQRKEEEKKKKEEEEKEKKEAAAAKASE